MLFCLINVLEGSYSTINKSVSLLTHSRENKGTLNIDESTEERAQFLLASNDQTSLSITSNQTNYTGVNNQKNSTSKSAKFKDPFEDDKLGFPIFYEIYYIFQGLLHLALLVQAMFFKNRYYQIMGIIQFSLLFITDIMSCVWIFMHNTQMMSFKYLLSVVVIWSVSNVITIYYSFLVSHGIGLYATVLKGIDIIKLTLISIISMGINIFISIAYYIFEEKAYKIIISILLPMNFLIEFITIIIVPNEFSTMHTKLLEVQEKDSNEYKKIHDLLKAANKTRKFSMHFLVIGALNPVLRYIMHFGYKGYCTITVLWVALFFYQIYLCFLFDNLNVFNSSCLIDTWAQNDEPIYI